ncbi:ABC transporter substrate-binding protein [Hominifimenecus sp. rT4P-3]|uniref:ABC transporter substrate-binding protein n=1 Tax=Hominifimenecus sp. rT4P-3 TaxID=3242979 RepID=UPI003DA2A47E
MKRCKLLACGMSVLMAMGMLAGCGSGDDTATTASAAGKTEASAAAADTGAETAASAGGEVYKIGIIQHMDHPSLNQIYETIVEELKPLEEAGKIEIVYQNASGDSTMLPTIVQEMLTDGVNILVPIATPTAQVAASATKDVPIVFSAVSNPVEAGLVEALDKTDGNITGVSNSIPVEDIIKLAAELTPDVKTFGMVYNTSEINSVTGIEKAKAYCDANGLKYEEATVTGTADVQQAASSLVGSVDAFFTPNDNTVASAMAAYLQVANEAGIPIYVGADSMVIDGGLATVGIDYTVLGKQTAQMVERLVNGETIAENPVEQIAEYAKMINAKTAKDLNIELTDAMRSEFTILGE